uniref:Tumor protein p53-inducible protein 11 n=3 Tax=Passeriformes TaxID=9126 RepID=A0A8C0U106_CYACU
MAAKQPPPLMKKHSQTDLVSRLKTRKILGVGGEDDDGEVHRSKISQVLGNEIKFAVREPLGLRVWQLVSAVMFSGVAIMALAFPDQLFDAIFEEESVSSKTPIRLYGGALLSIALIMWNALYTAEKAIIRWSLLAEACYFAVQFLGECPRAGQDEEEEEGAKTVRGGKWGSAMGRAVVEDLPCQLLAFFLPHGIASALSCSLNIILWQFIIFFP